ncbi:rhodanese-like domain-containing protein [Actinokineospora sp. NBRC 105648]|uniref:rhodanese-like domain-containing protein n=1 Tax=Actinokineospora sp. NBRC 105648 TaxID=3032206 RepID=UPI0024A532A9|nr:rhodanese-like domain-containing protein [Actinokineospora sp. NBRC 105648]GLZ36941.1 sulfurtransferase [Actinokineospora sp. NBRC 105648]
MLPLITRAELRAEMLDGTVVVVDTMPVAYYEKEHIPGAVNIPGFPYEQAAELTERYAPTVLPDKAASVVVYCANTPCRNSELVGEHLLRLGYTTVRKYREGIEDWVSAGGETTRGAEVG